jgi:hypothetical protein
MIIKTKPMVKRKQRERMYEGTIPPDGLFLGDNGEWAIYERNLNGGYLNVKVVALQPRTKKANFYLGYKQSTKTLTNSSDGKVIVRDYPLLCAWVLETIRARMRTVLDL